MLVLKTFLVAAIAPLISALTTTAGYPSHAVAAPNPFDDANRVEFNYTTYLANSHAEVAEKRGQPGMYFCRYPNWGWPCWWQPAVWQCVNTPDSADWSLGPDTGVFCNGYADFNCPSNQRLMEALHQPGNGNAEGMRSYRCATEEFWW